MIKYKIAVILTAVTLLFSGAAGALAAPAPEPGGGGGAGGCGGGGVAGFLGFRAWDACLDHDANGVPQFKALEDVWKVAIIVVEFFIKISGYLAAGFIIWGGIKYQKSQGEPGELTQARQIITNALMGLIICLLSVAIVQFIAGTF
ncbi:MAG TPA: hypothetical protein VJM32_06850 [Candidatus Saccharimonadales bacterium]|nr:hypothetical protein [Candidatus Saccharimonadales bacterium]